MACQVFSVVASRLIILSRAVAIQPQPCLASSGPYHVSEFLSSIFRLRLFWSGAINTLLLCQCEEMQPVSPAPLPLTYHKSMKSNLLFALLVLPQVLAREYSLADSYQGANFFDTFQFFTGADPTHGRVHVSSLFNSLDASH